MSGRRLILFPRRNKNRIRTLEQTNEKEKRRVYLTLIVEKIEFSETAGTLRISGKIIEGPDDISHGYHTLNLGEGDMFDIRKEWKKYEIDRLEKSIKTKKINVLIALVDEHCTAFYNISENRISELGEMNGEGGCKIYKGSNNTNFYAQTIRAIEKYAKRYEHIIIAGPGFTKDNIFKQIKDEPTRKKIITEGCSNTTKAGVNEVIKRGAIDRIIKDTFLSKETELVTQFLSELGKDSGLAVYGKKETKDIAVMGAIDILLISDTMVRNKEVQNIINSAEKSGAEIHIIGTNHDAGKQLYNLGGIAGITKYKMK